MKGILATDEAKSKMGFVVTVFGQEQSSVLIFTNLPRELRQWPTTFWRIDGDDDDGDGGSGLQHVAKVQN